MPGHATASALVRSAVAASWQATACVGAGATTVSCWNPTCCNKGDQKQLRDVRRGQTVRWPAVARDKAGHQAPWRGFLEFQELKFATGLRLLRLQPPQCLQRRRPAWRVSLMPSSRLLVISAALARVHRPAAAQHAAYGVVTAPHSRLHIARAAGSVVHRHFPRCCCCLRLALLAILPCCYSAAAAARDLTPASAAASVAGRCRHSRRSFVWLRVSSLSGRPAPWSPPPGSPAASCVSSEEVVLVVGAWQPADAAGVGLKPLHARARQHPKAHNVSTCSCVHPSLSVITSTHTATRSRFAESKGQVQHVQLILCGLWDAVEQLLILLFACDGVMV